MKPESITQDMCRATLRCCHVVVLSGLLVAAGAAEESVFQAKHIARLRGVTSVAISPDGSRIAYILAVPRAPLEGDDGPSWSELHMVDPAGHSRPYITGKVGIGTPQWHPDGSKLFYVAKRGEDKFPALYAIPVDGGESSRVLAHDTAIQGFSLSKDGAQIAFLATEPAATARAEIRAKGFDQEIFEEDASPTRVWVAPLDGSVPPRALSLPGSASSVSWIPNRRELVVVFAPSASVDDSYMRKKVRLVDVDSGKISQAIDNPGKLGDVACGPGGDHVAMISAADLNDPQEGRLMVAKIGDTTPLRDLLPELAGHVTSFAWRDAESIVWLADVGTKSRLGITSLSGQTTIVEETMVAVSAGIDLSANGQRAVMTGHTPGHPAEVFVRELADSAANSARRLTDSNPWLAGMKFAKQETVRWKARDGLELEGILVYPLNHVAGRRYPLIMVVHGGPESHEPDGWMTTYARPGQFGAAQGFAVFYPNYRGSTGRGVEFSKAGQADAAGKEFDDLIDGIDHLVAMGLVDKDHVGITGGSYGGYASAWGATYYSDRFAASVMFVGISDNISKVGTTDIPEEMYLVHHRKRLWDDWDYFRDRSPIRHVQKCHTPTLILHGKQDPRVHPSQSLELHRHLKTLAQAPVRLVLYEGEGHGNRKAAARFDYSLRLMQWMEHYLQGPGGEAPDYALDYASALK